MRARESRYLSTVLAARLLAAAALSLLSLLPMQAQNATQPARLSVDLQESARRIFHVQLILPAKPGPLTLLYPKWIPGEHAPDGPIEQLVGLKFTAGGKTLPWRATILTCTRFTWMFRRGLTPFKRITTTFRPSKATVIPRDRRPIRLSRCWNGTSWCCTRLAPRRMR